MSTTVAGTLRETIGYITNTSTLSLINNDLSLGVDAGGNRTLTLYSSAAGYYSTIHSVSSYTLIQASGSSAGLYLRATGDVHIQPSGTSATYARFNSVTTTLGIDGTANHELRVNSSVAGDYFTLTTASDAVTLSGVGTSVDLILVAADDIHLRPTGGDVLIGTNGGGNQTLWIHSNTSGDYATLTTASNLVTLSAVGTGTQLVLSSASSNIQISSSTSIYLYPGSQVVYVGTDGGGSISQYWYSSVAGDYATLVSGSNAVTLSAVGTGNDLILAAADDIHLLPTGGDVFLGQDAGGGVTVTWFGTQASEKFTIQSGASYTVLQATGLSLRLASTLGVVDCGTDAGGNITQTWYSGTAGARLAVSTTSSGAYFSYASGVNNLYLSTAGGVASCLTGGSFSIGVDAGGDRTLTVYSSVAGDYATLTTASNLVTLNAVSAVMRLASSNSNITMRPEGAGVDSYTFGASAFTFGVDAGGDKTFRINSSVAGDYLSIVTASNAVTLSAVGTGNTLVLAAADDINIIPSSGDLNIGTDDIVDQIITVYSSVAGDFGRLTSNGTAFTIGASGAFNTLNFESTTDIRFRPYASTYSNNSMYVSRSSANQMICEFGYDGQVAANMYFYSATTGAYVQSTYDQIKAYNTSIHIGSTTGGVMLRPGGASSNYLVCYDSGTTIYSKVGGGQPTLRLVTQDLDEPALEFQGSGVAGTTQTLSTYTTPGAIQGFVRVAVGINGGAVADYWMPYYAAPSA